MSWPSRAVYPALSATRTFLCSPHAGRLGRRGERSEKRGGDRVAGDRDVAFALANGGKDQRTGIAVTNHRADRQDWVADERICSGAVIQREIDRRIARGRIARRLYVRRWR